MQKTPIRFGQVRRGRLLFDLGGTDEEGEEELFAEAEASEEYGQYLAAAELYRRCLVVDPKDAVAAFNRANCLRAAGRSDETVTDYLRSLKIDPSFAEAWFNLADLKTEQDRSDEARRCLQKSIALDPDYADAIYNLARLEFEADNLLEGGDHDLKPRKSVSGLSAADHLSTMAREVKAWSSRIIGVR